MAQEDYAIANQAGAAFRTDLNNQLLAIVSNNSGATAPATTFAYQWWCDTTTGLLKIRNAANSGWVTVGTLASANFGLAPLASPTFTGTVTIPTVSLTTPLTIADGGTGQGTAASAFAAIKQAASTSATGVAEQATDAEALGGTDTTRFVTSASLASAKSLATSGYQKLPGGLILQWGRSSDQGEISGGSKSLSLTFPVAFPNAVLNVVPSCAVSSAGHPAVTVVWDFGATTLSAAAVKYAEYTSFTQTNLYIVYFAVGY